MKKLIITEKANAARRISTILSDGKSHSSTTGGVTVISFESGGDDYDVVSLRGHIIELDYPKEYNDWSSTSPVDLVYAPQVKTVRVKSILGMIRDLASKADEIIIATDYDREGELIGMETVREAGADMSIVKRAKFSALTKGEVENAFDNLTEPDKKLADAAEAAYEQWVRENASSGSGICAEGFIWPLPSAGRVTTEFGASQNVNGIISTGHKGIDIAVAGGTPIYAAHNGTVAATTGHSSYGNVVMIDNGDGISTLYAHMQSAAIVGVGQTVTQGQVIGYVGSTGNSSGNHLHFEVRVNGVRQNPRNYISPP